MDFIFIGVWELSALHGLPYIQQSAYILGIKPHLDRKTGFVGIKRRISYQSIAEALYIEPHPGIKSGSPSRQQLRRIIKGLEKAGLIEIHSDSRHLIVKCPLAMQDNSAQNKADTIPTPQVDTKPSSNNQEKSARYENKSSKADTSRKVEADIPHNSNNLCVFVRERFEKFWTIYPQRQNKPQAFDIFIRLNPSEQLFQQIILALEAQIQNHQVLTEAGQWVPKWKYPANWLLQQCWNDELTPIIPKEYRHEKGQRNTIQKSAAEILSATCGDASFEFEDDTCKPLTDNVIQFNKSGSY